MVRNIILGVLLVAGTIGFGLLTYNKGAEWRDCVNELRAKECISEMFR